MSTKNQKILYAIKNNPLLIGNLIKDTSINRGMIYRELTKAVPCRIGIEFELSGSFREGFIKTYGVSKENIDKTMTNYYDVYSIDSDGWCESEDQLYEIRVSILNFKQLKGLYKFMQDLPKFCKLHEGGGIHIHVDISKYFPLSAKEKELQKYIVRHLQEVVSIFPKYTGKFNKREVGISRKATYLNISNKKSLEFRIAPLSFDYATVISWVIKCIKFRNKVIHDCRLKQSPTPKHTIKNIQENVNYAWRELSDVNTCSNRLNPNLNSSVTNTSNTVDYDSITSTSNDGVVVFYERVPNREYDTR